MHEIFTTALVLPCCVGFMLIKANTCCADRVASNDSSNDDVLAMMVMPLHERSLHDNLAKGCILLVTSQLLVNMNVLPIQFELYP